MHIVVFASTFQLTHAMQQPDQSNQNKIASLKNIIENNNSLTLIPIPKEGNIASEIASTIEKILQKTENKIVVIPIEKEDQNEFIKTISKKINTVNGNDIKTNNTALIPKNQNCAHIGFGSIGTLTGLLTAATGMFLICLSQYTENPRVTASTGGIILLFAILIECTACTYLACFCLNKNCNSENQHWYKTGPP